MNNHLTITFRKGRTFRKIIFCLAKSGKHGFYCCWLFREESELSIEREPIDFSSDQLRANNYVVNFQWKFPGESKDPLHHGICLCAAPFVPILSDNSNRKNLQSLWAERLDTEAVAPNQPEHVAVQQRDGEIRRIIQQRTRPVDRKGLPVQTVERKSDQISLRKGIHNLNKQLELLQTTISYWTALVLWILVVIINLQYDYDGILPSFNREISLNISWDVWSVARNDFDIIWNC